MAGMVNSPAPWLPEPNLPENTQIETGPDAWILLSRQKNIVTIKGNSTIGLLPLEEEGRKSRISQRRGEVFFEVDKRRDDHFIVETPYLAAVVKGTTFGVSVSNAAASVSVSQGQVSVSTAPGGGSVSVTGDAGDGSGDGDGNGNGVSNSDGNNASDTGQTNSAKGMAAAAAADGGGSSSSGSGSGNDGGNGGGNGAGRI